MKAWVTMTDKFMSGWGMADGKINKLIFECDSLEQAEIVEENAAKRSDMKNINICRNKPSYNSQKYYAEYKTNDERNSKWYEKGAKWN